MDWYYGNILIWRHLQIDKNPPCCAVMFFRNSDMSRLILCTVLRAEAGDRHEHGISTPTQTQCIRNMFWCDYVLNRVAQAGGSHAPAM